MAIEEDPPAGVPEWVVTYGDMMSLLLTFFIMLVSMSEMKKDDGKFRAMMNSLHEVFGPEIGKFGAPGQSSQKSSIHGKIASLGSTSKRGMSRASPKSNGPGGEHNPVRQLRYGKLVTLGGPVIFQDFSADLSPQLIHDLELLVKILGSRRNQIEVRGHSSAQPMPEDSPFRDALDLSFVRAKHVAEFLMAQGIEPARVRVTAAGDTEPRLLSKEAEAQVQNHRVDVFLLDTYIAAPAAPRGSGS